MATKNLARTVIEGGRSGNYKNYVHFEKRRERQRTRTFCNRFVEFMYDEEWCEEEASNLPEPLAPLNWTATDPKFRDKLSVLPYWLYAHVGELWNEVNSLVRKRFDDRTIAGQHILFDHLLPQVLKPTDRDYFEKDTVRGPWDSFVVDDEGILQLSQRGKELFNKSALDRDHRKVKKPKSWKKDRLVIDRGATQFWTEPVTPSNAPACLSCVTDRYSRTCHYLLNGRALSRASTVLRQTVELSHAEKLYWESLSEYTKKDLRYQRSKR